jgi:hypothetical protein
MLLITGIIIFIIGCCLSSYEENSYQARKSAERRHRELVEQLNNLHKRELSPRGEKRTRRRIAKDKEGNTLAEEVTEEIIR